MNTSLSVLSFYGIKIFENLHNKLQGSWQCYTQLNWLIKDLKAQIYISQKQKAICIFNRLLNNEWSSKKANQLEQKFNLSFSKRCYRRQPSPELSENLEATFSKGSPNSCPGAGTRAETVFELDSGSQGTSSMSGEGANSGEGGETLSYVWYRDTTREGLPFVVVTLVWTSSSSLILLCWLIPLLCAFTWSRSKVG